MKESHYLTIIFILSLIFAFFLGMLSADLLGDKEHDEASFPTETAAPDAPEWTHVPEVTDEATESLATEGPVISPEPTPEMMEEPIETAPASVDFSELKSSLDAKFSGYVSEWIVYVEDIATGSSFTSSTRGLTENSSVTAASVIKLFIAGAVYDAALQSGANLDEATISKIDMMLSWSDNNAANDLIRNLGNGDELLGFEVINNFILKIGCTGSRINRLMLTEGEENLVSAADCARVLRSIYDGSFVSKEVSSEILEMLKRQHRISKIPSGVVGFDGVDFANKTGELDSTQNDVALIFTPNGDYIICIFASGINNTDDAIATFGHVSKDVCSFYIDSNE